MRDISGIVKRAKEKNVSIIVNNGVDVKSNRLTLEIASRYKEVKAALGIYPIDGLKMTDEMIDREIEFIRENKDKILFLGETGIDLKQDKNLEKQKFNFLKMIRLAKEIDRPIVVHARGAEKECVEILEKEKCRRVLMHCFTGNMKLIERIIANGWMISIPTNITFSEHFQKVVERFSIENMLCETDSPFLHPIKGKRDNEPVNVIESYRKIAEIKKMKLEDVEEKIFDNFQRFVK
jgi:TatD DNase family protein